MARPQPRAGLGVENDMKITDVRSLPDEELVKEIAATRGKIFKLRFQAKGSSKENPGAQKGMKRDVARMLTVLRQRQLERQAGK